MSFSNVHRLQSIAVAKKSHLLFAMKKLNQGYPCHATKQLLASSIVELFHKHCQYFELMSIAHLNSFVCNLNLQCSHNCPRYVYLNTILEFYYSPYLFLLLHSPPTDLPNIVHGEPCQLECNDLLSGNMTVQCQILNSHEIIHSLKDLHVSRRPEIPVKFPDLSECIILTFLQCLLQIQCYDDSSLIQLVLCYIPLSGELPRSNKALVECILKYEFGFKVFHVLTCDRQIPYLIYIKREGHDAALQSVINQKKDIIIN